MRELVSVHLAALAKSAAAMKNAQPIQHKPKVFSNEQLIKELEDSAGGSHLCGEWNADPDALEAAASVIRNAVALFTRAHAVMLRCHWNEPTGLEGDEDSALQVERDVREFLGK